MSKGIKVSKAGVDVKTATNKELLITSQFDTLKIALTGSLSISLPSETLTTENVTRTTNVSHNLGYVPMFQPAILGVIYTGNNATGGDYVINDYGDILTPAGAYGPATQAEESNVYIDDEKLYLYVNRFVALGSETFGARTVTLHYTIFYNKIDETMDLL
jgi:hypothetical protein